MRKRAKLVAVVAVCVAIFLIAMRLAKTPPTEPPLGALPGAATPYPVMSGGSAPAVPPGLALPDPTAIGAQQGALLKLIGQYGLDPGTAAFLAQAKAQVLGRTDRAVHFALTLPEGISSDETLTLTPGTPYAATAGDAPGGATGGLAHDVEFRVESESATTVRLSLKYVVPYSVLAPDLLRGRAAAPRWPFDLEPIATAQAQTEGGLGMGVSQEAALSVAQSLLAKQAEKGNLSKNVPKPLEKLLDVLNALKKEQEHVEWLNELDDMRWCTLNPTNALTQKAFDQNPAYRDQVLQGIEDARSDVAGITAMRFLNLAATVATDLVEAPIGMVTGKVADQNEATLKELGNRRVGDAGKSVVNCKNPPRQPGSARSVKGAVEYKYNRTSSECKDNACTSDTEMRHVVGEFELRAAPVAGAFMGGAGKATLEQNRTGTMKNPKCHAESHSSLKGALPVSTEGGGTPLAAWIRLTIGGDGLTGRVDSATTCGSGGSREQHQHWEDGGFNLGCEFDGVDMVHGGTYASEVKVDHGYGTCVITVSPE